MTTAVAISCFREGASQLNMLLCTAVPVPHLHMLPCTFLSCLCVRPVSYASRSSAGSSSHTIYVAITSGDVLGGRESAERREDHLKFANYHHEVSIRVAPSLAPAAAALRVRRFANTEATPRKPAASTSTTTVSKEDEKKKVKKSAEDSLIVGPDFEFVRYVWGVLTCSRKLSSGRALTCAEPLVPSSARSA